MSARRLGAVLDGVTFSGLWVALAATALVAAAAATFGVARSPALLGFVAGGTFAVYAVDRLRDLARDRHAQPLRSAFVERHWAVLALASGGAALAAAAGALHLGAAALAVAAVAGGLGLAHRRLKQVPIAKGLYVAAAWTAVTVVLPACLARPRPAAATLAWAVAIVSRRCSPTPSPPALATARRQRRCSARGGAARRTGAGAGGDRRRRAGARAGARVGAGRRRDRAGRAGLCPGGTLRPGARWRARVGWIGESVLVVRSASPTPRQADDLRWAQAEDLRLQPGAYRPAA
ncbi:MAG: hypothetical protein U0802_13005 [Candidatus Binatia bacterium]